MSRLQASKYRERSSRTSSASRLSERVVKPTRSAKRTETRRRSAAGACRGGGVLGVAAAAVRAVPHSAQKRCPSAYGAPHDGHASASGAPHSTQNFAVATLSVPQLGQVIASNIPPVGSRRQ